MRAARRYLVVARVGDRSLHPGWVQGERDFDLVIDYYGDTPGRWTGTADLVLESKGPKWQGLHALLAAHPQLLTSYDAVWFPDDDIAADSATISAAFALHTELGMGLSQPALTADSYFTHLATLAHPGLAARVTNFVEVMVPMFSRQALAACWETFAESRSGYGLDLVWQSILPGLGLRSAIFDCLTVTHTRPLSGGVLHADPSESPQAEGARVARAHGMPSPVPSEVHEVLTAEGSHLVGPAATAAVLQHLPVPTNQPVPPWDSYERSLRHSAERTSHEPRPVAQVARPSGGTAPRSLAQVPWPTVGIDEPVVLVAGGPDVAQRADVWRSAGWTAVVVPPRSTGDREGLVVGPWLAMAELHPVRILDVAEDDADSLERAAARGAAAGAAVIARPGPTSLECHHDGAAGGQTPPGRCEACARQWSTTAQHCTVLITEGRTAQHLAALVPDAPIASALPSVADLVAVAAAAAEPAVEPLTVVIYGTGDDSAAAARTTHASLAHQRGLSSPCEVLMVTNGPAELSRTAASARHDRVLVLAAGDVAGPWCVADHRRAATTEALRRGGGSAGGVVVSRARPSLTRSEDVYENALVAPTAPSSTSERVSMPAAALAGLSGTFSFGSAFQVAAVSQRLASSVPVPQPTHEATWYSGVLEERAAVAAAAATAGVASAPEVDDAVLHRLAYWTHVGEDSAQLMTQLLAVDEPDLRRTVVDSTSGERAVDLLAAALADDLEAHATAADLAVHQVRSAVAQGRPWTIAVDADDVRILPLLAQIGRQARAGALDATALRVVVVLPSPGGADERSFAHGLAAEMGRAGVALSDLGFLEVVASHVPAHRWLGADVTLPSVGAPWHRGLPVPLLGLPAGLWVSHLDLVALATRAEGGRSVPAQGAATSITLPSLVTAGSPA